MDKKLDRDMQEKQTKTDEEIAAEAVCRLLGHDWTHESYHRDHPSDPLATLHLVCKRCGVKTATLNMRPSNSELCRNALHEFPQNLLQYPYPPHITPK